MSKRPVKLLIEDIWDALIKIDRYVAGLTKETFAADDKTVDAVARNFEIIGEAAARLSEDFRSQHENIEWKKIIGLRHRIIHGYFGIDLELLWLIIQKDLPIFRSALQFIRDSFS